MQGPIVRRFMWTSNESRHDFLNKTPDNVHYLFASHSAFAKDEASPSHLTCCTSNLAE